MEVHVTSDDDGGRAPGFPPPPLKNGFYESPARPWPASGG